MKNEGIQYPTVCACIDFRHILLYGIQILNLLSLGNVVSHPKPHTPSNKIKITKDPQDQPQGEPPRLAI